LFTNFALFVGKFFAGLLSNSIAIMADSFNNLTDCISSVVTIFGFAHARRKADEGHPYGHGRMEYVAGLVVSIIIIVTGIAVADEVIRRIIDPQPVNSSLLAIVICVAAILIKVGLAIYIRFANRKVESSTLAASGRDSISDAFATTVALTSMVIAPMVNFPIDGYLGIVVTLFILWSGLKSLWENVSLLLGQGLKTEERNAIHDMLRTYKLFDRALELDVHDYGPESRILLAKVHLSNTPHTDEAQRDIEKAKADLETKFGFEQVIIYWSAPQHKAQK
jgi:cation diffusion facilitator family transporter